MSVSSTLPAFPYKGLSYYGPKDVNIFGGRRDDVARVAVGIADTDAPILILHGRTGCGKSSFLRAGLIPFLERPRHGFRFLKEAHTFGQESAFEKAVFVRSTGNPLARLAEEIFGFVSRGMVVDTPVGLREVELGPLLERHGTDRETVVDGLSSSRDTMIAFLIELGNSLPGTLVVVIDQAEEVMTLAPPVGEADSKRNFFEFLGALEKEIVDIKLLIAIRTEFFGEFLNELYAATPNGPGTIGQEILGELGRDDIIAAIRHPTDHDEYRFGFDDGVPERIADDLQRYPVSGGELPVMQIICGRLYQLARRRAKSGEKAIITLDDYESLGKVDRQIEGHLHLVLSELCKQEGVRSNEREIERWYALLEQLVRVQVDGTVTTEQKTEKELTEEARRKGCEVDASKAIDFLADERKRILHRVSILDVNGEELTICSLGHDAIGLALNFWKTRSDEEARVVRRFRILFRILSVGVTVTGIGTLWLILIENTISHGFLAIPIFYVVYGVFLFVAAKSNRLMLRMMGSMRALRRLVPRIIR